MDHGNRLNRIGRFFKSVSSKWIENVQNRAVRGMDIWHLGFEPNRPKKLYN